MNCTTARTVIRGFSPFQVLTAKQLDTTKQATLDVLRQTGLRFEHERALELFAAHGCEVDLAEQRVRIPEQVVQQALGSTPGSLVLRARDPARTLRIGCDTLHFQNSVGLKTVDLGSWEARAATLEEQHEAVRVLDALDTVHGLSAYTPYTEIEGIPPCMTMLESLASRLRNSSKSTAASNCLGSEVFAIEMAQVVGCDLLGTVTSSPPLTYLHDATEALWRFVESGFPINIAAVAIIGATGPATIAGSVVTTQAELIGGIVLAQLLRPGAGILVSAGVHAMDMQTGQPAFGNMASILHSVTFHQLWQSYGIPSSNWIAGTSSSKVIDFQCGCEKALAAEAAALSGANVIALHGAIHGELTFHPVQAVLDEDVAGMVARLTQGVDVSAEALAGELIAQTGPIPGHYLSTEHTKKWWRAEQSVPRVMNRELYASWIKKGKRDALSTARQRVVEILTTHEPLPLDEDQDRELDKILMAARAQYRRQGLM